MSVSQDMNDRVAEYRDTVESLARQFSKSKAAHQVGAEYDDLAQEGMLAVWQSLQRGIQPAQAIISLRMKGWIRLLARQTGKDVPAPLRPQHIPYEQLLPLDDLRAPDEV